MIYRITFDLNNRPAKAEVWEELSKIPPTVLDANPNGFKFDGHGWVNAENEEDALLIANNIAT